MNQSGTKSVLIITTGEQNTFADTKRGKELAEFMLQVSKKSGLKVEYELVSNLIFSCSNEQIEIHNLAGKTLDQYDVIHLRNVTKFQDAAVAIAVYSRQRNITVVNQADASGPYFGKLSQMFVFAANGISVPATVGAIKPATLKSYLTKQTPFSYPFILKSNSGIKGSDNHLVASQAQLSDIASTNEDTFFVAQEYIPNDGDYRILLAGDQPALVFKKSATGSSHLNNTAQGAKITIGAGPDLPGQALSDAVRIQELVGRDLTGIDVVVREGTSQYYFFEANDTPLISGDTAKEEKETLLADYFRSLL